MRAFGEWEKQEALLIALPHKNTDWKPYLSEILNSYLSFVKTVAKYQKVILIAHPNADIAEFSKIANVETLKIPTNDTWIRDFGAISVQNDDKSVEFYDFTFNAWGAKFESSLDNAVNKELSKLGIFPNLKEIPLVLEGGSIDFNGSGVLLTTSECLLNKNRGKRDKMELESRLKELFGLEKIIWLENGAIKGDDTDSHIDTLARFIDENTIVYAACDDKNDEHYKGLLAMKKELEKTDFNLVPLPLPKPVYFQEKRLGATYANFVIINEAIILPTYNDKKADEIAINTLLKHTKGHEIIPVDASVFIRQNGSLHCSCQNIFA